MDKLKRLKLLLIYGLQLLKATRLEFLASKKYLESLFNKYATTVDLSRYKTLINSIYFNTGLMGPTFYEYARLVGKSDLDIKEKTYNISAFLLIEDILLDELKVDPKKLDSIFIAEGNFEANNILETLFQQIYNKFLYECSSKHKAKYIELISRLHKAQISNKQTIIGNNLAKGLWLPALVFLYNPTMSFVELKTLQKLGVWIKYVDDYVDIEDDKKVGNANSFSTNHSKKTAQIFLDKYLAELTQEMVLLPYHHKKLERFIYGIRVQTIAFKKYNQFLSNIFILYKPFKHKWLSVDLLFLTLASVFGLNELLKIKIVR